MTQAATRKHLLGLEDLSAEEITRILDSAEGMKAVFTRSVKKVPALVGKTICSLFFEDSTRTRTSFELAAKRLSADTLNIAAKASSVSKGETMLDTAKNIQAMNVDAIIVRHNISGTPKLLADNLKASII